MTRIVQTSSRSASPADARDPGMSAGRRFLDAVSEEILRPVNSILAVADLLARQPLSADAQAYVRTIIDNSHSLMRSLEEAKDLIGAEGDQLSLSLAATSLHEFMDAIQNGWEPRAAQAGIALLVSYDGEDFLAMIDARRLRQVFDHLIEHAIKMTRKGGIEVSLRARRSADGIVVEGSVRDSGLGMPPERLARIFEAHSRASDAEMGLGLALSRRIVEAMNGAIRAESNIGAGSTIAFGLVVQQAEIIQENPDHAEHQALRCAHVLVVDDNATNRMVAEALCEMFDCTSESAEDGVEAVEAAKTGRFDLILMDIKMPRMDGVQATRAIRDLSGPKGKVPIIALTANADPEDARGYLASGMSSVVEKPIKAEALLAAMTACLPGGAEHGASSAAA
jgi:CheY-like chemotaxis protein